MSDAPSLHRYDDQVVTEIGRQEAEEAWRGIKSVPPSRIPATGPTGKLVRLNSRMLRMIDLMVNGVDSDPSHPPLDPFEAGRCVGYKRGSVRWLALSPAFVAAYEGAKRGRPVHVPQINDIVAEQRAIAADREARWPGLQAAQASPSAPSAPLPPPYLRRSPPRRPPAPARTTSTSSGLLATTRRPGSTTHSSARRHRRLPSPRRPRRASPTTTT
jgi:hypothetical protein